MKPARFECIECREEATECREVEGLIVHLCREHALELDADRMEEEVES